MSSDQQVDKIEFANWGMRVAVIQDDGSLEHESELNLDEHFGGILPSVGDFYCPIGPGRGNDRILEVVGRYWITDFGGETCWWVVTKEIRADAVAKATFRLARRVTKQFREADERVRVEQRLAADAAAASLKKLRSNRPTK